MTAHARLCSNRRPGKSLTAKKKTSSSTTRARRVAARATAETKPKGKVAVFVSGGGSNLRALHAAMEDGRVNAHVAVVVSNIPSCGGVEWSKERGIPTLTYPPKKGEGASIARATHTHQSTRPSVYPVIRTPRPCTRGEGESSRGHQGHQTLNNYNKSFQPTLFQNLSTQHTEGLTPDDLVAELQAAGVEYVLLAGYLRLIPPQLCRAYEDKMLNVHPALLPAFGGKGMHGHHVHEAVVASGARFSGPTVHFVNEEFDKGKIVAQRHVDVKPGMDADDVAASVLAEEHLVFAHVTAALVDGRIRFREDGVPVIVGLDGVEE